MPPRWSRKPDRNDPDFRKLDDRMTFATHVAGFAASNAGLWFFHLLPAPEGAAPFPWVNWLTPIWLLVLVGHGVYVFAIADYSR